MKVTVLLWYSCKRCRSLKSSWPVHVCGFVLRTTDWRSPRWRKHEKYPYYMSFSVKLGPKSTCRFCLNTFSFLIFLRKSDSLLSFCPVRQQHWQPFCMQISESRCKKTVRNTNLSIWRGQVLQDGCRLSKKEAEQLKQLNLLEKSLAEARRKVER